MRIIILLCACARVLHNIVERCHSTAITRRIGGTYISESATFEKIQDDTSGTGCLRSALRRRRSFVPARGGFDAARHIRDAADGGGARALFAGHAQARTPLVLHTLHPRTRARTSRHRRRLPVTIFVTPYDAHIILCYTVCRTIFINDGNGRHVHLPLAPNEYLYGYIYVHQYMVSGCVFVCVCGWV